MNISKLNIGMFYEGRIVKLRVKLVVGLDQSMLVVWLCDVDIQRNKPLAHTASAVKGWRNVKIIL